MDIDIGKLKQLLAIAHARSFSRAAESLNLTQPALSRSVANIEQRLGFRLFERGRSGVAPTAAGALALADAEMLVRSAQVLEDNMRLYGKGHAGVVKIGLGPLMASLLLADLTAHLLTERPRLQLRCSIKTADHLLRELLNGEIDVMFCGNAQSMQSPGVTIDAVGTFEVGIFVRRDHPLAGRTGLRMDHLADHPLACAVEFPWPDSRPKAGGLVCDNYELLRDVTLRADTIWLSSPKMVDSELRDGRIVELSVSDAPIKQEVVSMLKLSERTLSPAAQAVSAEVVRLLSV